MNFDSRQITVPYSDIKFILRMTVLVQSLMNKDFTGHVSHWILTGAGPSFLSEEVFSGDLNLRTTLRRHHFSKTAERLPSFLVVLSSLEVCLYRKVCYVGVIAQFVLPYGRRLCAQTLTNRMFEGSVAVVVLYTISGWLNQIIK